MEKIIDIIHSIAYEKDLEVDEVQEILKNTFVEMAKQTINENFDYNVYIDDKSKKISLFQKIFVVEDEGSIQEGTVSLKEALEVDETIEVGDFLELSIDLEGLKRSSTNFLLFEIEKRLQELIDDKLFTKYEKLSGKIVRGNVIHIDDAETTIVELNEMKGFLPLKNRIKGEKFKQGDAFQGILKNIKRGRQGIYIEVSRTTPKFLEELLYLEVPELKEGQIELIQIARIPGIRAKIALKSYNPNIDPIGSIVGVKGVRIKAVSEALNGENVDCIEHSDDIELFISRALSPAIVTSVKTNSQEKKAIATLAPDQKKKAIGIKGYNIRLASMLTGYHIDLLEQEVNYSEEDAPTASSQPSALDELFSTICNPKSGQYFAQRKTTKRNLVP